MKQLLPALFTLVATNAAFADPAEIVDVTASEGANGWRFDVSVAHGDTGWDDYADGWRIETVDGQVLGERPLAHPHVDEQPFTRSVTDVEIPDTLVQVMIRASTSVEGYADTAFGPFPLPRN